MNATLLATLHFSAIAWMLFSLGAEMALTGKGSISRLRLVDASYGFAAVAMLATGILRLSAEKGVDYYLASPWFHVKITAFVLAGIISAYPTVSFLKTPKDGSLSPKRIARIRQCIVAQLVLIAVIIFSAVSMARGW